MGEIPHPFAIRSLLARSRPLTRPTGFAAPHISRQLPLKYDSQTLLFVLLKSAILRKP